MKINPVPNVVFQIKLHCMIMFTFELRGSYNMQNRNVTKRSLQLNIWRSTLMQIYRLNQNIPSNTLDYTLVIRRIYQ